MLQKKVVQLIRNHELLTDGERVLVAYSGGPDSSCLLMLLRKLGYRVSAVYVNHALRGVESSNEEAFIRSFCESQEIPLFVEIIHWKSRPSNLEEAARRRRYRHLEKVALQHNFEKVALGHHKDDVVETFLLRLIRGSGPCGLSGIQPVRGRYIRPLLECSRVEILSFLKTNKIRYFNDTSNDDLDLQRNRIRKELIPYIQKHLNPAFPDAITRSIRWINEQNHLMDKLMQPYRMLIRRDKSSSIVINWMDFQALSHPLRKAVLRLALAEADPDLRLTGRLLVASIQAIQSKKDIEFPGYLMLKYSGNDILLTDKDPGRFGRIELSVPSPGQYRFPASKVVLSFAVTGKDEFHLPPAPHASKAFVDLEKAAFPLYIRNFKKGDRFRPFGMKGHKKLSDFFIDKKVSRNTRKAIPLVFKDDDLIWVAGLQIHDDYRVTESTKRVLCMEMRKDV